MLPLLAVGARMAGGALGGAAARSLGASAGGIGEMSGKVAGRAAGQAVVSNSSAGDNGGGQSRSLGFLGAL